MTTDQKIVSKETKEEKFIRLAERRVNVVLERLGMLGQLSDRKNYSYTDAQINRIFRAVEAEVKTTKGKFREESMSRQRFTL